jgi:undecaprenyl-diphosphatase
LHGPAELLPISSSAHVTALPWLLGWGYPELDPELRKSFEVGLHAGSALAWLASPSSAALEALGAAVRERRQAAVLSLAVAPAAAAGWALERPIERHLGTPGSIALGLVVGSLSMVAADRSPGRRPAEGAGPKDGLWLGLAQAGALVPGISRGGATLAAARWRGFSPGAAWTLSARVATPVLAGAAALRLLRMTGRAPQRTHRRPQRAARSALLAGGAASALSSLASVRVLAPGDQEWPLWPFAAYRSALALALIGTRRGPGSRARRFRSARR